jgi:hypothetical protein
MVPFALGLLATESEQKTVFREARTAAQDDERRVERASLADVAKELAPLTFAVTERQEEGRRKLLSKSTWSTVPDS